VAAGQPEEELRITPGGREDLQRLEPVWLALQAYHVEITPQLGDAPACSPAEAWRRRRAKYERWLEEPETFVLLAERAGRAVGYAFVTVGAGFASWGEERLADLQTLSVVEEERGRGVGTALMDAVDERLAELGVRELKLTAANANAGAQRFYERRGLRPSFVVFFGRAGKR